MDIQENLCQRLKQNIKKLNEEAEVLDKIEPQVREKHYLNVGIFYGLVFGIVGNLLVTLSYDLFIETATATIKIILFVITLLAFSLVLYLMLRQSNTIAKYYQIRDTTRHIVDQLQRFVPILEKSKK
jgi:cell division protein FtsB